MFLETVLCASDCFLEGGYLFDVSGDGFVEVLQKLVWDFSVGVFLWTKKYLEKFSHCWTKLWGNSGIRIYAKFLYNNYYVILRLSIV